jgi:GNAT superfamily N-acetyltransferase
VQLFRRTREQNMPYLPILHDAAEDALWLTQLVTGNGEVWLVLRDAPAGFMTLRDGWLDNLYVAPEMQGNGIGSELLAHAKKVQNSLQLWVFQKNVRAIAFYESRGFVLEKQTDGAENEEREPDALYCWHAVKAP